MIIKKLIETIKQGDVAEIKKVKKEIEKADINSRSKEWKEFIETVMIEFEKATEVNKKDVKLQIAINSVLDWRLTFYFGYEMRDLYSDFVLKNIQNKNGSIRQQSVKMGSNFVKDVFCLRNNSNKRTECVINFVKKIIELIEKYREIEKEKIEKEKPCVYKSLMFLLEEVTFSDYIKKELKNEGILEKTIFCLNNFYEEYYSEEQDDSGFGEEKDAYYDAMDMLCAGMPENAVRVLLRALTNNENNIELYVGLASAFEMMEDERSFEKVVEDGYRKLKDKFPEWPKEMFWGYMENRQFLRMIDFKASLCFYKGDKKQAEEIYKLLLKLNPGDNQGIRYYLAGLYENISAKEMNKIFDKENKTQDRSKTENMLLRQNKIHNFFKYEDEDEDEEDEEDEEDLNEKKQGFSWKIN